MVVFRLRIKDLGGLSTDKGFGDFSSCRQGPLYDNAHPCPARQGCRHDWKVTRRRDGQRRNKLIIRAR